MPIGTVKFFNADKGYGFIQPEDGGNDAFVHISAVERAGMATLDNVRDRCLRSEAAWSGMAARAARTEGMRVKAQTAKDAGNA